MTNQPDQAMSEHLISPAGGTTQVCTCGKQFYRTDLAQQHVNWHLNLAARAEGDRREAEGRKSALQLMLSPSEQVCLLRHGDDNCDCGVDKAFVKQIAVRAAGIEINAQLTKESSNEEPAPCKGCGRPTQDGEYCFDCSDAGPTDLTEVSLCPSCNCATHTIISDAKGNEDYCGKCGVLKPKPVPTEGQNNKDVLLPVMTEGQCPECNGTGNKCGNNHVVLYDEEHDCPTCKSTGRKPAEGGA